VWDHVRYRAPTSAATDPWIALATIAVATERIQLGAMVTPLPRRRPQIVARQVVAIDQLAGGRVVLGVGLGLDASGEELSRFGEEVDDRTRARMLDEGLDITGLLSGEEVDHAGVHDTARARCLHGVFLIDTDDPAHLTGVAEAAADLGRPFDIVVDALPGDDAARWAEAGCTWHLTTFDQFTATRADVHAVIESLRRPALPCRPRVAVQRGRVDVQRLGSLDPPTRGRQSEVRAPDVVATLRRAQRVAEQSTDPPLPRSARSQPISPALPAPSSREAVRRHQHRATPGTGTRVPCSRSPAPR